jgi:hypothetical protein
MIGPIQSSPARPREKEDPTIARVALSRVPTPSELEARRDASIARVASSDVTPKIVDTLTTNAQRIQAKLDEFRAIASGPYFVEGLTVSAPAHFRMNGGRNQQHVEAHRRELADICAHAHPRALDPTRVMQGRGTAHELVAVTQALIDAGKLPPGKPEDLALRIHRMQWEWGIGFDCAGYAQQAFLHTRGGTPRAHGLNDALDENLAHLSARAPFVDVGPTEARPGDIFSLRAGAGDSVGHVVIVRSHEKLSSQSAGELRLKSDPQMRTFLQGGPIHRYEVDSSWGAGDGADSGGLRRDTWLYNEATREWGFYRHVDPTGDRVLFYSSKIGPCDHPIDGVFRPKSEV